MTTPVYQLKPLQWEERCEGRKHLCDVGRWRFHIYESGGDWHWFADFASGNAPTLEAAKSACEAAIREHLQSFMVEAEEQVSDSNDTELSDAELIAAIADKVGDFTADAENGICGTVLEKVEAAVAWGADLQAQLAAMKEQKEAYQRALVVLRVEAETLARRQEPDTQVRDQFEYLATIAAEALKPEGQSEAP